VLLSTHVELKSRTLLRIFRPAGPDVSGAQDRSFRLAGYPAVMFTDTSFFRNPNYHTAADRPDTLDYERMARVVDALEAVLAAEAE
jgi:hypothetical protein